MQLQELESRRLLAVQDLSSFPAEFTPFGNDVVFGAQSAAGYELWKYNGSVASLVADINPTGSSFPSEFTVVGGSLYFVASAGNDEFRLWKYDGAAVSMVLDATGLAPLEPSHLTEVSGELYFVAEDGLNGRELWRSNGTPAGTSMVKDIFPADTGLDGPDQLINVNGSLYFIAYEHDHGWELWQSNGTAIGTQLVADINPGHEGSLPQELTAMGNSVYFRADNGTNGEELWVRMGSSSPVLVTDLLPTGSANPRDLTAVGNELFFSTIDPIAGGVQMWFTDGTAAGTELAETFHASGGWDAASLVEVAGDLFMSLSAIDERAGWELWKLETTTRDATRLAEFSNWGQWLDPWTLTATDDRLYFSGFDVTFGHELWSSDGTVSGTQRLTDINPRVGNTTPMFMTGIDDSVYFAANDGNTGVEPYLYQPLGFGLQRLANIAGVDVAPKVQISRAFDSDSGYENDDGITNVTRPAFVVDVDMPGQVSIDFDDNGAFEFSQAVDNWGTREFTPAIPFADGLHTVTVRFTANSVSVFDETDITIDTVGPTLVGSFPVEDTTRDFHTLFFDEPINEEHLFDDDFLLSGPGIAQPISLKSFYIDFESDAVDVGFAPLSTPGLHTITIDSGIEDLAGNLLRATSPNTTSFQVLSNAVFLDDAGQTYTWDPSYEGKDLVLVGATLSVSGVHGVSSLWLLDGAMIASVAGQPLEINATGAVVIDETSTIVTDGNGFVGGGIGVAGSGTGAGAVGTTGGGGGGYGGVGGIGGSTANAPGGTTYGVANMPIDLGSGGGGSSASTGGAGGGSVKITVGTTLLLDGDIRANGAGGTGANGSGGAGGSVWLVAASFQGQGTIQAEGADAVGFGGAGGGGRIAVVSADNDFVGTLSVAGGTGTNSVRNGGVGTVSVTASAPGARNPANAARPPGDVTRNKDKAPTKYTLKNSKSDNGSDLKRQNSQKETERKTQTTIKDLPPGSYQVRYKGSVSRSLLAPQTLTAFVEPARGVPRQLQFNVRAQLRFAPTIVWDGGGNGTSWTDPLNWSTDVVPGANDLVSIPEFPGTTISLTSTVTVAALFSDTNFQLSGSLTIKEPSVLNAQFTMSPGATLTASGVLADFVANGVSNVNGANFFAVLGGQISLPGVVSYSHAATGINQTRTWQASGPGSRLSLPNLVTILNNNTDFGGDPNSNVQIQAFNGGVVDLSQVTQMADPIGGDTQQNQFLLTADGLGSLIDLSALTQLHDRNSGLSTITPTNGAEIRTPQLTTVIRTNLVLNKTGIFPVAQLTNFTDGQLTLSGANGTGNEYAFTNLHTITRTTFDVDGVDVALGAVTNADGANFLVEGGVALTLPGVVSYVHAATGGGQVRTWRASGPGSRLSLPNLVSILNDNVNWGNGSNSDVQIQALNGSVVDLSQVAEIADPLVGDTRSNTFSMTADGLGSLIDLSALTQLIDRNTALSSITASNVGRVQLNPTQLVVPNNVTLSLANNGVIAGRIDLVGSGSLSGSGTIEGELISSVTVSPVGMLRIEGDYRQRTSGLLDIDIFGGQPEQADSLVVTGHANIRGELHVDLVGYTPILGDAYPVFQFATRQGNFDVMSGLNLANNKVLVPRYTADRLTLVTASANGTGIFQSTGQMPGSANARGVALGDVDNDGDLDAFMANGDLGPDRVWLNNGAATFVDSGQALGASDSTSVAFGDFDRDGDLDAYVTGPLGDRVWRNRGGQGGPIGTFIDSGMLFSGGTRMKVVLGDVDGDGDLDAFVAVSSGGNRVLINQGGIGAGWLGFSDSGQVLGALPSVDVQLGDIDGDNDLDAIVANAGGGNQLWRNQGGAQSGTQGLFVVAPGSIGTGVSTGVDLADLDADGDVDAFFTTASGSTVWRNNGSGTFTSTGQTLTTPGGRGGIGVSLGDVDGDGDVDAFVADTFGSGNIHSVWFNQGSGTFFDTGQQLAAVAGNDVELADLDADGDLDAFVANGQASVQLGNSVFRNVTAIDFGDAPDPTYPTTLASNGAGHIIVPGIHLGSSVDAEPDGVPHPFALGDDLNVDDENGVVFLNPLFVGVANSVSVTASAPGKLDAWIDFNSDGDWDDAGEKVFVSATLAAGVNTLNFVVPATATATFATFARFRFSTGGGLTPRGIAANGEVEDYFVPIGELDLGDAPTGGTLLADNGARHVIVAGYHLGTGVSPEPDGQPNSNATGDASDDGVILPSQLVSGRSAQVTITASAAGMIDAWIDFNNDNDWNDAGEQVFTSLLVHAGSNSLSFNVPATAVPDNASFARFRFSSVGGQSPQGVAPNGEVEDYRVRINRRVITYQPVLDVPASALRPGPIIAEPQSLVSGLPFTYLAVTRPATSPGRESIDQTYIYQSYFIAGMLPYPGYAVFGAQNKLTAGDVMLDDLKVSCSRCLWSAVVGYRFGLPLTWSTNLVDIGQHAFFPFQRS